MSHAVRCVFVSDDVLASLFECSGEFVALVGVWFAVVFVEVNEWFVSLVFYRVGVALLAIRLFLVSSLFDELGE